MKIIIISENFALIDEVRLALQKIEMEQNFFSFEGGFDDIDSLINQEDPGLAIIDWSNFNQSKIELLGKIGLHHSGTSLIVLSKVVTPEFLIAAIRIGVKDVLTLPLVHEDLRQAVIRLQRSLDGNVKTKKEAKVIAFISGKGGSGVTFLSCNFAYILAAGHDKNVAMFDLNLQLGDAVMFVSDHSPPNTLADVVGNISRLDASLLESSMVKVLPNFGLLAAPEDAEHAAEVKPEHLEILLKLAKTQYDYIILDVGRVLNANSIKALDYVDHIFLVMQETLPFIRDSKRLIFNLQSLGCAKEKIHILINRYEKNPDITTKEIEDTLGVEVFLTIPNSYETVSASVNQGVPIMKISINDAVTKALQVMAEKLTLETSVKSVGWFSRLLKNFRQLLINE